MHDKIMIRTHQHTLRTLDASLPVLDVFIRLYKLERIFSQQVDLKSALDSKDFLLNNF